LCAHHTDERERARADKKDFSHKSKMSAKS
jgi:hypothetical protein